MKTLQYDIFISYRRTSYNTAKLIAEKLRHAGYKVFFDVDTLTAGKFNEQLLEVISNCKDFILVLPEKALDRCYQPDDWIRKEVICAMEHKKNIIPVMLDGFSWPQKMPEGMEELPNYQAITAIGHEYFDMAVQRLQSFLKSRPSKPIKLWLTKIAVIMVAIFIIAGIGFLAIRHMAGVACESIGTQQSAAMNITDLMGDMRVDLQKQYDYFYTSIKNCDEEEEKQQLEQEMLDYLKKLEKEIHNYRETLPEPLFDINGMEAYVLSYYNIKREELNAFNAYYKSIFDDMDDVFECIQAQIELHDYSKHTNALILMNLDCMGYSINGFYYGYLGSISLLPKSARTAHYEMAKKWTSFPNGTPLDLSQEEYEQFQMQEIHRYEEELNRFGTAVKAEEDRLDDIEEQVEELQKIANELNP